MGINLASNLVFFKQRKKLFLVPVSMFESLENIDKELFLIVNGFHTEMLDKIIPILTNFLYWTPLFLYVIWLLIKRYKAKVIYILITVAVLITCSDQGANLIKKNIKRYRPTHNTEFGMQVHTVENYKGGQFGFVSGHASNSFALATFFVLLFKTKKRWINALFFLWAIIICYTRVYLGVHYPSDLAGGALLGIGWGFIIYNLLIRVENKFHLQLHVHP